MWSALWFAQSDIAGMIERPDRFVALDAIGVYEGAIAVDDVKDTYDAAAAKRLDINLDDCIIWVGMDVRTESGDVVGYCSDVEFKPRSGIVQAFYVTAGAASSVLVGDTQVPPTMLRGYENGAMIVSDEVKALGYSGGAAAKAAEAGNTASPFVKPLKPTVDYSKIAVEPLFEEFVDFDTFSKSDFRAVKVKACEAVKKSKKLLNFTLDDGTGTDRTILSGIHDYYEPEDLVGKTLLAITNLPPRKMMGIPSCGMLISAIHEEDGEERLNLIQLDASIPAGAKMY